MKYIFIFYILFILFSPAVKAQNLPETKSSIIDKKLDEVATNRTISHINPKEEVLLLEILKESEKSGYTLGILRSSSYLMRWYGDQGRYKEAVEIRNKIKSIIPDKTSSQDKSIISDIYRRGALALCYLGFYEDGLKDFKTAIHYAEAVENNDERLYLLSLCYENMTIYYHSKRFENKKYRNSIVYYHQKSLEALRQISDSNNIISKSSKYDQIAYNYMRLGIFYLEQADIKGSLETAEKYLLEGLKIHENKAYHIPADNKIMLLNQLSWLYLEKKEYKTAIDYAKHALQLEKQHKDPYHRVESFEFLASSYTEIGEKEKSAFYMREYSYLKDSLSITEKNSIDAPLKQMVSEIDNSHKKNTKTLFILITGIILVASTIALISWRRQNRIIHKKYEALITKISKKHENIRVSVDMKNKEAKPLSGITDDTSKSLLQKLEKFEESEKFLHKDISVAWLSNYLDTNTKYLSEGIKIHRDKNFADYINGLKINYIINKLYGNPIYREYKINYLAEECGYATPRVFLNAFKKKTGLTPSYFIKELQNEKVL